MPEAKPVEPRCPHCESQPIQLCQNKMAAPDGTIICNIWCGSCGTILNIQAIGQQAPKVIDPSSTGHRILQM
jgi:hypothetical protein